MDRSSILLQLKPNRVEYAVPARLLEEYSGVYREEILRAPEKQKIAGFEFNEIDNVDPMTVEFFTKWIRLPRSKHRHPKDVSMLMGCDDYDECIKAWKLGEFVKSPEFQNDIIRVFLHSYKVDRWPLDTGLLTYWMEKLPRQSAIHRLVVDIFCHQLNKMEERERDQALGMLPKTTLYDITRRLYRQMHLQSVKLALMPVIQDYIS